MGKQLAPRDMELWRRIDEVLFYLWDPIGVKDQPRARSEYDSYAAQVFSMVKSGKFAEDVADYLLRVTQENLLIGMTRPHLEIAETIFEYKEIIDERA